MQKMIRKCEVSLYWTHSYNHAKEVPYAISTQYVVYDYFIEQSFDQLGWFLFHWIVFLRLLLTIVSIGQSNRQAITRNQWWPGSLTYMCVSKP